MRILVATNLYPPHYIGGYELRCRDIVEGLIARGHEVHVLTSTYGVNRRTDDNEVYRHLPVFIYDYTKMPSDGMLRQFAKALRSIAEIRRLVRRKRIEAIYISKVQGFQEPVIATLATLGIPILWDISDYWISDFGQGPWFSYWQKKPDHAWLEIPKSIVRSVLSWLVPTEVPDMGFDKAFYTSEFLRDAHREMGFPTAEAGVIHCGCPDVFMRGGKRDNPGQPFRFLYVGQLVEHKGVHTVLEAARILAGSAAQADFLITFVGEGIPEYEKRLRELAMHDGLAGKVEFRGKAPRQAMPEVYRQHDALIFPSLCNEAFALTILEAMASGLPVISTTTGGSREIIEDGRTALAFEAGNAEQLASRMDRILCDRELRRGLSVRGREIVSSEFTVSRMVDKGEECLTKTTNECRGHDEYPARRSGNPAQTIA